MIRRTTSVLFFLLANVFLLAERAEAGFLYVVNSNSNSIARFDASGTPAFVTATGVGPQFIAFDSHGDFYVSTPALGSVHKYSQTGADLGTFVQNVPGADGLAFDSHGNLYVSERLSTFQSDIRKFSPTGADLGVFASGLHFGAGITFDSQGNLYVADVNSNNIHKFSSTGADLGIFASAGLDAPIDLKFDQHGNLYVASNHLSTIHEYSPTGADLGVFATGPNATGISGLVFDSNGNLYAGNGGGFNTIREFSPTGVDLGNFASTGLSNPVGLAFAPQAAAVPEPASVTLLALGGLALTGHVWRKRRARPLPTA